MSYKKRVSINEELDRIIRMLFQVIIEDIRNNVIEERAGWRNPLDLELSPEQLKELSRLKIMEKNLFNEIRISFIEKKTRKKLKSYEMQFKQIKYFKESQEVILVEDRKCQMAQEILDNIVDTLSHTPEILSSVVAIGLWKMLSSSEMPAIVDNVLKEGFSPKSWAFASIRSVPSLSVTLTQQIGQIRNLVDAFESIKQTKLNIEYSSLDTINNETIQQVKRVLKWDKIVENLTRENIQFLGLSWFMVFALERNQVLPLYSDFSIKIIDLIKDCVERIMNVDWQNSVTNLETAIVSLEEQELTWTSGILFLPEVI